MKFHLKEIRIGVTLQKIYKVAVFASGSGSNAENIIKFSKNENFEVSFVLTDKKNAGVIERSNKLEVPCYVIPFQKSEDSLIANKIAHELQIYELCQKHNVEWVFLAGYMRILSEEFLNNFKNESTSLTQVVNIHPSLLPSFPGKNAYEQAFNSGVKMSGVTVHFVDPGVDTGMPIYQECFERNVNDSLEDFVNRGLEVEYRLYKKAIKDIFTKEICLKKIKNCSNSIIEFKD